jgi:hypothetical protein
VLPTSLVPPSMRSNGPASPFAAAPPQPTGALHDLLWDDSPPPQHNVLQPQTTGMVPPAISPPPVSRAPQAPQDPFTEVTRNCTSLRFLFSPGCLIHTSAFNFSIPQGSSRR